MSLKGVELQIAVPRTSEATSVQNQFNQRPAHDQAALAQEHAKLTERQRSRSAEVGESAFQNVKGEGNGSSGRRGAPASKRGAKPEEDKDPSSLGPGHPYKGKRIDISL